MESNLQQKPCLHLLQALATGLEHGFFAAAYDADGFRLALRSRTLGAEGVQQENNMQLLRDVFPKDVSQWLEHHLTKALMQNTPYQLTTDRPFLSPKGKTESMRVTFSVVRDAYNAPEGVIGVIQPMQDHIADMLTSRSVRDRYALALEYAPFGICFIGADHKPTMINRTMARMMNESTASLTNRDVCSFIAEDDRPLFHLALKKVISHANTYRDIEVRLNASHPDLPEVWAAVSMSLVTESNTTSYVILQFSDISKRKLTEQQLLSQATRDHLTGLHNRMVFDETLQQALRHARRYKRHGAVLYIDLDDFKLINDSFGHQTGDLALQTVANTLTTLLRDTDTIARIGGDEFAVILDEVDGIEAQLKADTIEKAINAQVITSQNQQVPVKASVGYHLFNGEDALLSMEDILAAADKSMYAAKQAKEERNA